MKKAYLILVAFVLFVALPISGLPQQWVRGFLRDSVGNVMITCKSGTSSDKYVSGFKRDSSGNLDANCSFTPGPTATPAPTPTPTAPPLSSYAYAPSYIYEGTGSGGGGSNDCAGAPCINGTTANTLNIRYMESLNSISDATWSPILATLCGTNNVNCNSVFYESVTQIECGGSDSTNIFNGLDAGYVGSGNDPGLLHNATPVTKTNRVPAPHSGTCATGSTGSQSVVGNPAWSGFPSVISTNWLTNASRLNSRTWIYTMYDNGGDIGGNVGSVEYSSGTQAAQLAWTAKLWGLYAALSPYNLGTNSGGSGGANFRNATYDSAHITFACTNHICNDPDGYCNTNPGNFKFILFERPLVPSGSEQGGTDAANNAPFLIDTTAEIYSNPGCNGTDLVDLEQPTTSAGADSKALRLLYKAVSMLLQPNDYDGTQKHRAWLEWLYNDCNNGVGCLDEVPVYPEYGLNFVPSTAYGKWTDGGGDGNGCHTGDKGGAADLKVACLGTDINGFVGAIYVRCGEAFKFRVDYGKACVIFNQTNQTQTIQNTWCNASGKTCNLFPKQLDYNGTGPEQYVMDTPADGTICTNASCNGSWAEVTAHTTIPACPVATTQLTASCAVILLSN